MSGPLPDDGVEDPAAPSDQDATTDAQAGAARGLRAITQEEFSALGALGGVRGVVESVVPGLLFVVVYLAAGQRLAPALISAAAASLLAVAVRLVQRTPPTQAFSGVVGVGIGVLWAWRTGQAEDYFLYGLYVNAAYLAGTLASVLTGWPLVGLVVGLFDKQGPLAGGSWSAAVAWRQDRALRRRYTWATWPWVALFGLRLLVQVPFYLGGEVAWLGTAKLAMGVPLTAVALWLSWMLVRGSAESRAPSRPHPDR